MNSIRYNILLLEKLHLQNLLLEDRMGWLQQNVLPRIKEAYKSGKLVIPLNIQASLDFEPPDDFDNDPKKDETIEYEATKFFEWVVGLDPDPIKKNVRWLFDWILRKKDPMPVEDLENAPLILQRFSEAKAKKVLPPGRAEINSYRSLSDMASAISKASGDVEMADMSEKREALSQSKVLLNNSNYLVLSPQTQLAAEVFGRNSLWCTDWGDPKGMFPTRSSQYENYTSRGPLYIVIQKNHPQTITNFEGRTRESPDTYYQFHFEDKQYMDAEDRPISLPRFLKEHPEVAQALEKIDGDPVDAIPTNIIQAGGGKEIKIFKSNQGFVGKIGGGPANSPILYIRTKDGKFIGFKSAVVTSMTSKQMAWIKDFLNRHNVSGDSRGGEVQGLWYRNGEWGSFEESSEVVMKIDNLVWRHIQSEKSEYQQISGTTTSIGQGIYRLYSSAKGLAGSANDILIDAIDDNGEFSVKGTKPTIWEGQRILPEFSHAVAELFIKIGADKFGSPTKVSGMNLAKEDAQRIISAKPEAVDLPLLYGIDPQSETFRDALLEWCHEESLFPTTKRDHPNFVNNNKLIIESFDTVKDLIEDRFNSTAKWIMSVYDGADSIDTDWVVADRNDIRNLIQDLDPEILGKLGKYMEENYPEDIEDIEDWNPNNATSILELYNNVHDDQILSAANSAMSDGQLAGTESEMLKTLRKEITNNDYIEMVNDDYSPIKDWRTAKSWNFDTKCVFCVHLEQIMDVIAKYGEQDAGDILNNDGWFDTLDIKDYFEVDEPQDGFYGFDKEVAKERFVDALSDFVE